MVGIWQTVFDSILRPARPNLARCEAGREAVVASRRAHNDERARAMRDCERRIEEARSVVFALNDGVVPESMTALEREWRRLSRPDHDRGLMDLWARIAPANWIEQKRYRDSEPACRVDAAIALAADVDGVETAIAALSPRRVRFRMLACDAEHCPTLLAEPLRILEGASPDVLARAERFEREVHDAALARLPERPLLARDVALAARVDYAWTRAELPGASPVRKLRSLWTTGYVISTIDDEGATLEIPALPALPSRAR